MSGKQSQLNASEFISDELIRQGSRDIDDKIVEKEGDILAEDNNLNDCVDGQEGLEIVRMATDETDRGSVNQNKQIIENKFSIDLEAMNDSVLKVVHYVILRVIYCLELMTNLWSKSSKEKNYLDHFSRMGGESGQEGPMKLVLKAMSLKDMANLAQVSKLYHKQATIELNTRVPKIQSVVLSYKHTMLLTKTNKGEVKLFSCGDNWHGQLGLGDNVNRNELTEVTLPEGFIIEEVIAGGHYHTILKGKGKNGEDKLYACGDNKYGQLGLGDYSRRNQWPDRRNQWTEAPVSRNDGLKRLILNEKEEERKQACLKS